MIKKLENINELRELSRVFALAFESGYTLTELYLETMLQNPMCVIFGAFSDQEIVGGLVAFEMMPMHGTKELYVYDIAVHPAYQRNGIGVKLVNALKDEAKVRGVGTIFVEAELEDKDAIAFYRAIGGEEIVVGHFNFKI
jgi:aminoglycoside 3-N-acetyltransferase I